MRLLTAPLWQHLLTYAAGPKSLTQGAEISMVAGEAGACA